ncbi:MAG: hypothetical protein LIO75_05700, partial [Lachnospiraceae bacterium]|nr:hypothetical protein [Lachnospiraceae bacterium]
LAQSLLKLPGVKSADVLEVKRPKRALEEMLSGEPESAAAEAMNDTDAGFTGDAETADGSVAECTGTEETASGSTETPENTAENAAEFSGDADSLTADVSEDAEQIPEDFAPETTDILVPETPEIRMEITAKPGTDVREDVFFYCAENGIVLLEMTSIMKSLEDVFLELTEDREVQ